MKTTLEKIFILNFFGNWLLGCIVFLLGCSLLALIGWIIFKIGAWTILVLIVLIVGGGIGDNLKTEYLKDKRMREWK